MTSSAIQPLTEAAPITFRAGRVVITLFVVRPGVFRVETRRASTGAVIDEWSCSYDSEQTARAEARRAARAFRQHRTADALADEHHRLTVAIEAAEDRRRPTGKLNDQRDAVQPLRRRAADQELAARILGTIHAAAEVQPLEPDARIRTWKTLRDELAPTHPSI